MAINTSLQLNHSSNGERDLPAETQRDYTTSYGLILIALVIIVGNCLVLATVKNFKRRLVSDILIFCLSLSDLTNTLTSVTLAIVFKFTLLHKSTEDKSRGAFRRLCQAQGWFIVTTQLQSIFIVTLMTLERFVAVSRPFLYKTHVNPPFAHRSLAALSLVSVLISSAPLLGWDQYISFPKVAVCMFPYDGSYAILLVVIGYADIVLVSYCFLAIRMSLKKFVKRQAYFVRRRGAITAGSPEMQPRTQGLISASGDKTLRTRSPEMEMEENASNMSMSGAKAIEQSKRLLKVSAMVSFLFYFSWLPIMIGITFAQVTNETNDVITLVASVMPLTSHLVNPLIYFISWERYKRSYISIVKGLTTCCPRRRSIQSRDLTKGADSAILSVVRNSGLLPGRLGLMECEVDGGDMCSDISSPSSLVAPRRTFEEIYSANTFHRIDEKYSKTFVELRRHSLDHVAKDLRRYPMSEFNQMIGSWSLNRKCSLRRGDGKRRHTVCGCSEKAVRWSEWGSSDVNVKEDLCNCILCGSTSEPQYGAGYIVRRDGAIHQISDKCKPIRKALPSKEPGNEQDFHPGQTSRDTENLKTKGHRAPMPWYKTSRSRGESFNLKIADVVDNGCGQESSAKLDCKKIAKGFKKGLKLEACCENDSDENSNVPDIIEGDRHTDTQRFSPTESCPITERIQEYVMSVLEDEKEEISLKKASLCEGDLAICSSEDATPKKFKACNVTQKSSANSSNWNYSNSRRRVTSTLRHKYRHHVSSKRTKSHQRDGAESHEVPEMDSPGEDNDKNKKFHRYNKKHLKDTDVALSEHSKTTKDKTLIWTYL